MQGFYSFSELNIVLSVQKCCISQYTLALKLCISLNLSKCCILLTTWILRTVHTFLHGAFLCVNYVQRFNQIEIEIVL